MLVDFLISSSLCFFPSSFLLRKNSGSVVVVGITDADIEEMDSMLRSKFTYEVPVTTPDSKERERIIAKGISGWGLPDDVAGYVASHLAGRSVDEVSLRKAR